MQSKEGTNKTLTSVERTFEDMCTYSKCKNKNYPKITGLDIQLAITLCGNESLGLN